MNRALATGREHLFLPYHQTPVFPVAEWLQHLQVLVSAVFAAAWRWERARPNPWRAKAPAVVAELGGRNRRVLFFLVTVQRRCWRTPMSVAVVLGRLVHHQHRHHRSHRRLRWRN